VHAVDADRIYNVDSIALPCQTNFAFLCFGVSRIFCTCVLVSNESTSPLDQNIKHGTSRRRWAKVVAWLGAPDGAASVLQRRQNSTEDAIFSVRTVARSIGVALTIKLVLCRACSTALPIVVGRDSHDDVVLLYHHLRKCGFENWTEWNPWDCDSKPLSEIIDSTIKKEHPQIDFPGWNMAKEWWSVANHFFKKQMDPTSVWRSWHLCRRRVLCSLPTWQQELLHMIVSSNFLIIDILILYGLPPCSEGRLSTQCLIIIKVHLYEQWMDCTNQDERVLRQ
jgi:hypothetical protein